MKKLSIFIWSIICFITALASDNKSEVLPYLNHHLPIEQRVTDLLNRLTLEEKVSLMMNESAEVKRLNIPAYDWWNEALHGIARSSLATVFPQAIGMAATFNDAAHYDSFCMISDEGRAKYHKAQKDKERGRYQGLTFWTPNINIFRDPRWGRGMETYGEDPYLSSRFGVAAVRGLQGNDPKYYKTHACAKHFAVHSGPEWNRHSFEAVFTKRDLWETYLPAFEALVVEGNVQEVMCAYNRFEGSPCCGSDKLLMKILRERWGFKGLVVSDCAAIDDFFKKGHHETHQTPETSAVAAVLSGTDIECGKVYTNLIPAFQKGLIDEAKLNVSLARILKARLQLGMFDPDSVVHWAQIPYSVVNSPLHQAQALKMARESITLLKNNQKVLPLSKCIKKIAIVGANSIDSLMQLGNYHGIPAHTVTILEGIRKKLPNADILYDSGCDLVENQVKVDLFKYVTYKGQSGMRADFYGNTEMTGNPIYSHQVNKVQYNNGGGTSFAGNVPLEQFSARLYGTFTAPTSQQIYFNIRGNDGYRLFINEEMVAESWKIHRATSKTVAFNVKQGEKYDLKIEYFQSITEAELSLQVFHKKKVEFAPLVAKLKDVDAIIYVGGLSPDLEGEEMPVNVPGFKGGDRKIIELPQIQRELLRVLRSVGKPVVFVLTTGSAIGLESDEVNYDALLNVWYPGQAGGTAVADVLFGDYNPAGRLPVTFYKSTSQLPDFQNYSMIQRTYRYLKADPLYCFGHGLSYTQFTYSKCNLSKKSISVNDTVDVTFSLKNRGKYAGNEVVQLYVKRLNDPDAPIKSLRRFKRISTHAGQEQSLSFTLSAKDFQYYCDVERNAKCKIGDYQILIGGTSDEDKLQKVLLKINN